MEKETTTSSSSRLRKGIIAVAGGFVSGLLTDIIAGYGYRELGITPEATKILIGAASAWGLYKLIPYMYEQQGAEPVRILGPITTEDAASFGAGALAANLVYSGAGAGLDLASNFIH